jgi:hypothetical protein
MQPGQPRYTSIHHRILNQRLERAGQHGAERAVDGAVIVRHGHAPMWAASIGAFFAGTDGEDGRLRRRC